MKPHETLKLIREEKKMPLSTLSAITGIQQHRLRDFENNNANITLRTYEKILYGLNVKMKLLY